MIKNYIAFENSASIQEYVNKNDVLLNANIEINKKIEEQNAKMSNLNKEINDLNTDSSGALKVVNDINEYLKNLGFRGFYLKAVQISGSRIPHYKIFKDNEQEADTNTLSEGEKNFIAFLYFYFTVTKSKDTDERISNNKIVIIDDPVSSLDNSTLHIVSNLIKDMLLICSNCYDLDGDLSLGDFITQIFIFTHNIYFHNEITHNQIKNNEYVNFYEISKDNSNRTTITLCEKDGQIFNPVDNVYSLLWKDYNKSTDPISVNNLGRQILDYYFIHINFYSYEDLVNELENKKEQFITSKDNFVDNSNYSIAIDLLRQISSYGHFNQDIINQYADIESVAKIKTTIKRIFEVFGFSNHYLKISNNE